MKSHYHLLVETPEPNLSQSIQWINVSYAVYFNIKRKRHGHLFQGRFKSILVDADEYLKELSRYIHLNPVRAEYVDSASDYPWSSYCYFIGERKSPKWLQNEWLLSHFGSNLSESRKRYRSFVEQVDSDSLKDPSREAVGGFILGGEEFVKWIKEHFLSSQVDDKEKPQLRTLKPRVETDDIVSAVGDTFACTPEQILAKGKKCNLARDVAIYLSKNLTGKEGKELGQIFGNISGAAITMRHNVVSKLIMSNRRLKRQIAALTERIINN